MPTGMDTEFLTLGSGICCPDVAPLLDGRLWFIMISNRRRTKSKLNQSAQVHLPSGTAKVLETTESVTVITCVKRNLRLAY